MKRVVAGRKFIGMPEAQIHPPDVGEYICIVMAMLTQRDSDTSTHSDFKPLSDIKIMCEGTI